MKKRALISVFYKDGVLELAQYLTKNGWEILSTGGTKKHLADSGVPVTDVSAVTGFPECLDGRVKTLHPKVHAGLLAIRSSAEHMKTIADLGVDPIDLVCVNLYPFFEKVQAGLSFDETVEFIDIGGPTMLRSAAKNHEGVLVLTTAADYAEVMAELDKAKQDVSKVPMDLKRRLAGKVFNLTSAYDAAVSRFMLGEASAPVSPNSPIWPEYYAVPYKLQQSLRYGENGHQQAALYLTADSKGAFGGMTQLQGKELSYNNMRDLDVAWKAACAYDAFLASLPAGYPKDAAALVSGDSAPALVVALKHNTPCGAALGKTALEAYKRCYLVDPVSIYGGIIGCNKPIDKETAEEMTKIFLEVVVAPDFTAEAREVFTKKKNVRLIKADVKPAALTESIAVDGGVLVQGRDNQLFSDWKVVTEKAPTAAEAAEMAFGMTMAMFVKSNAIVVVKDRVAVGLAGGQVNRIWPTEQSLARAKAITDAGLPLLDGSVSKEGATVMVSDAFFPFDDCVEMAAKYGIKAIVQPGGSMNDQLSIDAANKRGIAMVFTGTRHFKH
ncbi:MAG TPA: bifunctional phosphoribosylaminoimidazolecarboxamide formyltransferase/IMP cyclohydrolase [Treponemataceae bacterium]|nr:bifunctional phosphoribosylaminoimidazolecarboxamide formyltransferase/IMP cyclohydrolase [Treponemataceae bacterium]